MNRISYDLSGTTTVITGGSSGIGLATAELVAKSGGHVIVSESRKPGKTTKALERIRNARSNAATDVLSVPYEASDEASVRAFFEYDASKAATNVIGPQSWRIRVDMVDGGYR